VTPERHEFARPAVAGPLNGHLSSEPAGFGPKLRRERERRGISLEVIAHSTKIKSSYLTGLERDDVSQWPKGVFRRAFIREYATAIGLPPEPIVSQFLELFPEEGTDDFGHKAPISPSTDHVPPLRLTFERDPLGSMMSTARRWLASVVDALVVAVLGAGIAVLSGANPWMAGGIVALAYYSMAS
jgi:transcriptional regulator with XRE-family HTH domain